MCVSMTMRAHKDLRTMRVLAKASWNMYGLLLTVSDV